MSPDLICQASRYPCALPENAPGNAGRSGQRRSLIAALTGMVVRSSGNANHACRSTPVGGGGGVTHRLESANFEVQFANFWVAVRVSYPHPCGAPIMHSNLGAHGAAPHSNPLCSSVKWEALIALTL